MKLTLAAIFLSALTSIASAECPPRVADIAKMRSIITSKAATFAGIRFRMVQTEFNGITMLGVFYAKWNVAPVYFFMNGCLISQNLNMPAEHLAPFMTGKDMGELFPKETAI